MSSSLNLTSNKKFGYFFSIVFIILTIYFFFKNNQFFLYFFLTLSLVFILITIFKDFWLKELNNIWFNLGILLSKLVSPLILAIIFYFIITPFGIIKKIFKLGTVNYKNKKINSFWRDCVKEKENFDDPF